MRCKFSRLDNPSRVLPYACTGAPHGTLQPNLVDTVADSMVVFKHRLTYQEMTHLYIGRYVHVAVWVHGINDTPMKSRSCNGESLIGG